MHRRHFTITGMPAMSTMASGSVLYSCPAGAIVGGVLLVAVAVLVLFSALLCAVRRKRRHKFERGGEASLCQCVGLFLLVT